MSKERNRTELPMRGLLALEYIVDRDVIFVQAAHGGSAGYSFLKRPTKEVPRGALPDGAPEIDAAVMHSLYVRGFLDHVKTSDIEFEAGLNPRLESVKGGLRNPEQKEPISPFAWYDHPYVANDLGRRTLDDSRERLAAHRAELAAAPREFLVAKRNSTSGGAGAYCEVVRRTERRVYVTVLEPSPRCYYDRVVVSSRGNAYLAVDDVLAENVDKATWQRLVEATNEREDAHERASERHRERLKPIDAEHASQRSQIEAQFADEIAELLAPQTAPGPR